MKYTVLCICFCLLGLFTGLHAQSGGRHTLLLGIGGAGYGIGPVYEGLVVDKPYLGLGLSLALPLVHASYVVPKYSPFSVSPGLSLVVGRRALKAEAIMEYNYYREQASYDLSNGPREQFIWQQSTYAGMAGLRWWIPKTPVVLRADAGAALRVRINDRTWLPCIYVMAGIRLGKTESKSAQ